MAELARVIKPGGYLLLTTHGQHYLEQLDASEQACFLAGEMVTRSYGPPGTNQLASYHPYDYVVHKMIKDLILVDFIEKGARGNPFQDLYLLKKK